MNCRIPGSFVARNRAACLIAAGMLLLGAFSAWAVDARVAPVNPAFEAWRDGSIPLAKSGDFVPGLVPLPWKQILFPSDGASGGQKDLPASYDLRTLGDLTGIRNQGLCGSCWAFASYASAESWLLKNLSETWDFSENHLKNYTGFDLEPCDGGNHIMTCAYLARGSGPVLESSDPYHEYDDRPSPGGPAHKTLESLLRFHTPDLIKEALMTHGALYTAMWWNSGYYNGVDDTYYCPAAITYSGGGLDTNHAVTIVGWDDAKVVTGGPEANPAPGAWIIKNSWGTSWGEGGFFYISYYDTNAVAPVGGAYGFMDLAPISKYGRIYQYDTLGMCTSLGYGTDICWGANIFTADAGENLIAVSFYTVGPSSFYQLYVYDNFDGSTFSSLLSSKSGALDNEGYHTITLDAALPLVAGDQFALVIRLITPNSGGWPLPIESVIGGYSSAAVAHSGESYCSEDGTVWESAGTDFNVCLKGLTAGVPEGTVATPLLDPAPGVYTVPVSISCETVGATIRYTLDNTEPTETSTEYANPIPLTETTTVKAKAFKVGMTPSATAGGAYTVSISVDVCEAVDLCGLDWATYGESTWFGQSVTTHDGFDAAQSGDISDNQTSWIETTINGPGLVSFWWKVSCEEGWDELALYVNDDYSRSITGNVDWQHVTLTLPPGPQTLTWFYIKDDIVSEGLDCGWVDQVSLTFSGEIAVEDSIAPTDDRLMPFGLLESGQSRTEQLTIHNTDATDDLTISSVCVAQCYFEGFESGLALDWLPGVPSEWEVVDGRYRAQHTGVEAVMQTAYNGQIWADCALQGTISRTGGTGSAAALVARATEDFDAGSEIAGSAYMAGIDGVGDYYVGRIVDGVFEFLCPWSASPYLNLGSTPNTVLLNVLGPDINLYINGVLVWSGIDTSISSPGRIGLWGFTPPDLPTTHFFDDIQACGPLATAKAGVDAVQQWYNEHPLGGGTPWEAPAVAATPCPFTNAESAAPVVLGADADHFVISGLPALPAAIPPGGSLAFDVTYAPSWQGDHTAPLTIQSDDPSDPHITVDLTGSATAANVPAAGIGALMLLACTLAGAAGILRRRRG